MDALLSLPLAATKLKLPQINSCLWTSDSVDQVIRWNSRSSLNDLLWFLEGADVNVDAVLPTLRWGSLVFLIYQFPLIIMCEYTFNTEQSCCWLICSAILQTEQLGNLLVWVGRSSNCWRLICCWEKNKFCCLFKHFQTRLTISVHISAGWCQCFCSGHVIIGAHFSLWKKKHLGLKLKESHFYRLLEKDLFSDVCPT